MMSGTDAVLTDPTQEDWRLSVRTSATDNRLIVRCCYNWLDCYRYTAFASDDTMARKYFLSLVRSRMT